MNNLVVAGTQVRQDDAGRYCLNDLHKAAGGEAKDRPVMWLRKSGTQDLLDEAAKGVLFQMAQKVVLMS